MSASPSPYGYSSAIGSFVIGFSPIEGEEVELPGSATDYLRQRVLGHTLAFAAYTEPTGVYVALNTSLPTASTPGTEVTGGAYARQPATFAMSVGRSDLAANTITVEFPPATTDWGSIGYFEIWDAATAGNRLYWGPLVDPADGQTPITRPITVGDVMRLSVNQLSVQAI